ncbi:hypothetical protein E6H34_08315 [Candidatus Bathyarchaeota archaeon]|nr:MAG: hypothetical protein E6H34_08315 [Candidatus Bathyarchaeota archaeon]
MQRRKILIACLSLLLVGLALPTTNIKAHAFTSGNNSVAISNVLTGFVSPSGVGSGTVAQAGTSISATVVVQGSNPQPVSPTTTYTRNVTIGFKGDWMTAYQNASIIQLTSGQIGSTTLSIALPSAGSVSQGHSWTVEIWDGPATGTVAGCTVGDAENYATSNTLKSCFPLASGTLSILTGDQYSAAQARNAASKILSTLVVGGFPILSNSAAQAQVAQANSELALGDQSWTSADFAGAKTHYQSAQNDANAAVATQYNLGGSQTNASIVGTILGGTGTLLFGLGGMLAGIGGFFYLRRRPKA